MEHGRIHPAPRKAFDGDRLRAAFVVSGPLWALVPMHMRGDEFTWQDMGHIGLGAATVLLMTAVIGTGAGALDRRFRRLSLAIMAIVFVASAATFACVAPMIHQLPTPGAGLVERVSLYAWLLWIGVLAVTLRQQRCTWSLTADTAVTRTDPDRDQVTGWLAGRYRSLFPYVHIVISPAFRPPGRADVSGSVRRVMSGWSRSA